MNVNYRSMLNIQSITNSRKIRPPLPFDCTFELGAINFTRPTFSDRNRNFRSYLKLT